MDNFSVPKKINRHVLKAINYLNPTGLVTRDSITHQVAYQLRNSVPVPNLDHVIMMSLTNLTALSLLCRKNGEFCINRVLEEPRSSSSNFKLVESPLVVRSRQSLPLYELNVPPEPINPMKTYKVPRREEPDKRNLDPAANKKHLSEESLSGDEIERVRKRFQTPRRFDLYGGPVLLPRKRERFVGDGDCETFLSSSKNLPCFKQRHAVICDDVGTISTVESTILTGPIQYSMTICNECEKKLRTKMQAIARHNSTKASTIDLNDGAVMDKDIATIDKGYWLFVSPRNKSIDSMRPQTDQELVNDTVYDSSDDVASVARENNDVKSTTLLTAAVDEQQIEGIDQLEIEMQEMPNTSELEIKESVFYIN